MKFGFAVGMQNTLRQFSRSPTRRGGRGTHCIFGIVLGLGFLLPLCAAAAESPREPDALIAALDELDHAIDAKIDRDLDTIALAYWSAFEIKRARRLADWIMLPVEIIKTAFDINLFEKGVSGIRSKIERAKSALELAAIVTGLIQSHEGVKGLLGGPDLGDAIEAMITSASAHPPRRAGVSGPDSEPSRGRGRCVLLPISQAAAKGVGWPRCSA